MITLNYSAQLDHYEILEKYGKPVEIGVQVDKIAPQPGGQTDFLSRPEDEVLYGGAAGGGKTWCLVIDALGLQFEQGEFGMRAIDHPDYRAIIFRRKSTYLQKVIDLGKEYYTPLGASFVLQRKGEPGASFTFPSGAKIFCAHLESLGDIEAHQGQEYQYIGFDELTQFLLPQYLYLFSRLRGVVESKINPGVFLFKRMRATTNPTGEGLVWVRKRFIKNQRLALVPGQTNFFIADPNVDDPKDNPTGIRVTPEDPEFINAKSRTFIPGLLEDNKILMDADPGYAANIMQLGKKMEAALRRGDWDAFGGDFFDMFDKEKMREKPFHIPKGWQLVGAIDPGWSSPCCFILGARDFNRHVHILFTYYRSKLDPESHAKNIYSLIKNFPHTKGRMPDIIVSGTDAFAKKDLYSINKTEMTFERVFRDNGLLLQKAVTDRVLGWWAVKQYMQNKMFHYFQDHNEDLVDELLAIQTDEDNVEEIAGLGNDPQVVDHAADTLRYLIMSLPYPFATRFDNLPEWARKKWEKKKTGSGLSVMSK